VHHELGRLFTSGERNEVGGFGKPIHHGQDGGVAIRQGKTNDKVQGDVRPGTVMDRQRLEETSQSLPRSLVLCTDCASGDEYGDVRTMVGHQKRCYTKPWSDGSPSGRQACRSEPTPGPRSGPRQERAAGYPRVWLGTLCLTNLLPYSPAECCHQARGG
jgi:hypothetical protein